MAAGTAPVRKIIHIDMDCFFASVEMRRHPEYIDVPLAVGGTPEERGVLSTCNYPARKFGLHSAMATALAKKLCSKLVLLPVDFAAYKEESRAITAIFRRYTHRIEPLSLDEAFLDVTMNMLHDGSATLLAQEIRRVIFEERGLTASAGIAPNKYLAKVASDWNKPDGQFTIAPDQVGAFAAVLPVGKVPGVGKVSEKRMLGMGIRTCGDLLQFSKEEMQERFGSFGDELYDFARGIDERPVNTERDRKSISTESTFAKDISGAEPCHKELRTLYLELLARISRAKDVKVNGPVFHCFVKIKYGNFQQTTIEKAFPDMALSRFESLFLERYKAPRPVRLLGVGIRLADDADDDNNDGKPKDGPQQQLSLEF